MRKAEDLYKMTLKEDELTMMLKGATNSAKL